MAGQCATRDQMPSVGEFNSIVTAINAPLTTTENRRVSFSECSLTRPNSEQSVHAGDNFLCRPTSVYANETTAHLRIVGSSERPLKLTSTQNYHSNGGPRYSVEDKWNPRNYHQPNLRPNVSQARQPPGFASFAPYPYNVSYDELFLPRPEFKKFNGNPLEFRSFISNFETHIEPAVHDNTMLFRLLLQHCEDKIKSKIKHYADRGTFAYRLAKDRLQREYGRECLIADMCEQNLINAPSVKSNDPEGLKHYPEILEKALITLQGLSTFRSVNSLDSMTKLISKLPFELRRRWVKESVIIEDRNNGRVGQFKDFVNFVARESEEMNSLYGRRVFGSHSDSKGSHKKTTKSTYNFAVSYANLNNNVPLCTNSCWHCNERSHKLHDCPKFLILDAKDRSSFVKSKRLCYKCLSSRHKTGDCQRTNCCSVEGCKGTFHHTLLHKSNFKHRSKESVSVETKPLADEKPSGTTSAVTCSQVSNGVYLCVVPVRVKYGGHEALTYAFLDQESSQSFCDKKLIEALETSGSPENITLQTLTNSACNYQGLTCSLTVSSLDGTNSIKLQKVVSIADIPVKPNASPAKNELNELSHLKNIPFTSVNGATVTLLVGADAPEVFCPLSTRKGGRGEPVAVETPLGWSLLDPSLNSLASTNCAVNFVHVREDSLQGEIERLWSTDFEDGTAVLNQPQSKKDRVTYQLMQKSVVLVDGHYQLPLPWRPAAKPLPANRKMALRRLESLKTRLSKNQRLKKQYVNTIEGYLSEGYASLVPDPDHETDSTVWFLPHHPVINPKKSNKVRVVFDCAAKHKGICLNDALMQGPNLANDLVGVLIRFRKKQIAVTGDIRAMFHQVRVEPKDADALRFLWWPSGDLSQQPVDHRMDVHLFGATSSPSCASFCLRQVARDFGHLHDPITAEIVVSNFYVDDCLVSFSSKEEAIRTIQDLIQLLHRGGFHLTKLATNDPKVLSSIPEEERSTRLQNHEFQVTSNQRVLGVQWNLKEDEFAFDVSLPQRPLTRRGVLSAVSSLFDPLGFVAPITLEPKLLLQNLCKKGQNWDESLDSEDVLRWEKWLDDLAEVSRLRIKRCLVPEDFGLVERHELHIFSDASLHSYGSCCYLRMINWLGQFHCVFIMGKARVAPLKSVSVPRLELTVAVVSVRLEQLVKKEIGIPDIKSVFWTDSTAVLHIPRNTTKRFPVFVANRLAVIETHTTADPLL